MRYPVLLELRKMRRLRTVPLVAVLVLTVAALSSMSLFAQNQSALDDPTTSPWESLLLTYTLMAALCSPILTAVLASRQTDIEHGARGWFLAATAGYTAGTLCRAKLLAVTLLLVPATVVQSACVILAGLAAGIGIPLTPGPWFGYTAMLLLVNIAFCSLHIWLAAVIENQLVSVAVGMLGAFVAAFTLLGPTTLARVVPWGYYAVISHVAQSGDGITYIHPPYAWIAGFLALVAIAFALATRRLDHIEG